MLYKDLCKRLTIEKLNASKYLKGTANEDDINIHITNMEDEYAYSVVHINGVQMKFRNIQLGMQKPGDDAWLLICGFSDEKSIRIRDIKEIYFNHYKWETIHG